MNWEIWLDNIKIQYKDWNELDYKDYKQKYSKEQRTILMTLINILGDSNNVE
jgi:hypothetical protein